jgi:hypothetical protein
VKGHISGAEIETVQKCSFCHDLVVINQELQSVKSGNCNKRQLVTSVIKQKKCEIALKTDDKLQTCKIPEELLTIYTLGIENDEDK